MKTFTSWKLLLGGLLLLFFTACTPNHNPFETDRIIIGNQTLADSNEKLILAVENGERAEIVHLIKAGAEINAVNAQGDTPLMVATKRNDAQTVQLLIDYGADVNIQNDQSDNVLLYASRSGLLQIVEIALEAGADPTITDRFGATALIAAVERGQVEVVKSLLKNSDIDVNHANDRNWTALLEAIILGDGKEPYLTIVQLLIDHGADITIADGDGMTPLEHAEERNFEEIVQILKGKRPEIDNNLSFIFQSDDF